MKKKLRREIIQQRLAFSPEAVALRSSAVAAKILGMKIFCEANTIMTYLAFRNEIETREIIEAGWDQGKQVVIPVCQTETLTILPAAIGSFAELQQGTWGILEPREGCLKPVDPIVIDLVLVPGVAFDEAGNRLGYGAGYYDRFLPRLGDKAVTAALAYDEQVLGNVYPEAHDRPVDWVVTPSRIIRCRKN